MNDRTIQVQFRDASLQPKLGERVLEDESISIVAKQYLFQHFALIEIGIHELNQIFSAAELQQVVNIKYEQSWFPLQFIPKRHIPERADLEEKLLSLSLLQKFALADLVRCRQHRQSEAS